MKLSLVIPVFNEEDNIAPLIFKINEDLKEIDHEIIFVDDGSCDATAEKVKFFAKAQSNISLIIFTRNFGQTSAISAGISYSKGEFISTLDGDLQNDTSDIPKMLIKLESENIDIVSGVRKFRKDSRLSRLIPSKIANIIIKKTTKVIINDYGCTLKVFRKDIAKNLDLYGELHRFIPVLSSIEGAKIAEMNVSHHARIHGKSKYGLGRVFKVLSDLLLMIFLIKYRQKPMHLFGSIGVFMGFVGFVIEVYLLFQKIIGNDIGNRPLFYVGILLIILSIQFITTGFIAELLMRTYYGSQNKKPYNIKNITLHK